MRFSIKQCILLFVAVALLLCAGLPAGAFAEEIDEEISVHGQINASFHSSKGDPEPPVPEPPVNPDPTPVPPDNPSPDNPTPVSGTKTGDAANANLWLIVALTALLVMILSLLFRGNHRTEYKTKSLPSTLVQEN